MLRCMCSSCNCCHPKKDAVCGNLAEFTVLRVGSLVHVCGKCFRRDEPNKDVLLTTAQVGKWYRINLPALLDSISV